MGVKRVDERHSPKPLQKRTLWTIFNRVIKKSVKVTMRDEQSQARTERVVRRFFLNWRETGMSNENCESPKQANSEAVQACDIALLFFVFVFDIWGFSLRRVLVEFKTVSTVSYRRESNIVKVKLSVGPGSSSLRMCQPNCPITWEFSIFPPRSLFLPDLFLTKGVKLSLSLDSFSTCFREEVYTTHVVEVAVAVFFSDLPVMPVSVATIRHGGLTADHHRNKSDNSTGQ